MIDISNEEIKKVKTADKTKEGFVLSNLKLKIIDFNVSRSRKITTYNPDSKKNLLLMSIAGTPQFSAPELLNNITCYTEQVDIWSVGCLMFYLACGKLPYNGNK